ncbi:MAG: potassium channel family protein [Chloroflexi bacterium]|nr:potassium channel family protein [Chloroflexota bacterium]
MSADDTRLDARERFQRAVDAPMLVLSLMFVAVLLVPMLVDLSDSAVDALERIEWLIWATFAIELAANTYLAERRFRYLGTHWFDVLIVILPFLRPLRLARTTRLVLFGQGARLFAATARFAHSVRSILAERGLQYVLLTGLVLIVASAAAVTRFERGSDGTIQEFSTALWWAATTVTTVGYGDAYPVTAEGRGVAVFLMILGIALFGVLTASITSFFVSAPKSEDTTTLKDVIREVNRLEASIEELSDRQRGPAD